MNPTGIVRRIDDIGRIIIPKEIRRVLRLRDGDPMEMLVEGNKLTMERFNPMDKNIEQAQDYAYSFEDVTQRRIVITDVNKVIATTLLNFSDVPLSGELIEAIRNKENAFDIKLDNRDKSAVAEYAEIIKDCGSESGDGIGAVVLLKSESPADETIKEHVKIAAAFLGRLTHSDEF